MYLIQHGGNSPHSAMACQIGSGVGDEKTTSSSEDYEQQICRLIRGKIHKSFE